MKHLTKHRLKKKRVHCEMHFISIIIMLIDFEIFNLSLTSAIIFEFHFVPFSSSLETKLSTTPVTPLCVVFNGIVSTETDPLRKRTVLSLLLGKSALGAERLLRRLFIEKEEC